MAEVADMKRTVAIEGTFDGSKAEKEYARVIKTIQDPITLEADLDISKIRKAIEELQTLFQKLMKTSKDGNKSFLSVSVDGFEELRTTMESVEKQLASLQQHFTGFGTSIDIKKQIETNNVKLKEFQSTAQSVAKTFGGFNKNAKVDNILKRISTSLKNDEKALYEDLINGTKFSQKIGTSTQENGLIRSADFVNLYQDMAKIVGLTGTLNHEIQISKKESINLSNIFDMIKSSIANATTDGSTLVEKLQKLKEESPKSGYMDQAIAITSVIENIAQANEQTEQLQINLKKALQTEESGSINVNINEQSIKDLSDAISELKSVMRVEEGTTIGISADDVNRITGAFERLETVLSNIQNILMSFDIEKLNVPEIKELGKQPKQKTTKTKTVTETTDINGGKKQRTRKTTDTGTEDIGSGNIDNIGASAERSRKSVKELNKEMKNLGKDQKDNEYYVSIKLNPDKPLHENIQDEIDSGEYTINDLKIKNGENGLEDQIQQMIDGGEYTAKVDLNSESPLKEAIDSLLKDNNFSINLDMNINGKSVSSGNSPSKIISDMMEADSFMEGLRKQKHLRERGMYFNSQTGEHSNPYVFDQNSSFGMLIQLIEEGKKRGVKYDTGMHSHPERWAHMSINNEEERDDGSVYYHGDLLAFIARYVKDDIEKQIIAAQKDVQLFDAKGFVDEYGSKFFGDDVDKLWDKGSPAQELLEKFNNLQQSYINNWDNKISNVASVLDYVDKIGDDFDFDFSILSEIPTQGKIRDSKKNFLSMKDALKDIISNSDQKELSDNFKELIRQSADFNPDKSLIDVFSEYVTMLFSGSKYKNKGFDGTFIDNKAIIDFSEQLFKNNSTYYDDLINKMFFYRQGKTSVRLSDVIDRQATSLAFKDLGIDWDKYSKFMPMEEFKKMYSSAATSDNDFLKSLTDQFDSIKRLAEEPVQIKLKIDESTDLASDIKESLTQGEPYEIKVDISQESDLPGDIKAKIDEGSPYEIDVKISEGSNLADSIKKAISEGEPYKVEVELGSKEKESGNQGKESEQKQQPPISKVNPNDIDKIKQIYIQEGIGTGWIKLQEEIKNTDKNVIEFWAEYNRIWNALTEEDEPFINWSDSEQTLKNIKERLKEIYQYRKEDNFEKNYGDEVIALRNMLNGADYDFQSVLGDNRVIMSFFANINRFKEAKESLESFSKLPIPNMFDQLGEAESVDDILKIINELAASEKAMAEFQESLPTKGLDELVTMFKELSTIDGAEERMESIKQAIKGIVDQAGEMDENQFTWFNMIFKDAGKFSADELIGELNRLKETVSNNKPSLQTGVTGDSQRAQQQAQAEIEKSSQAGQQQASAEAGEFGNLSSKIAEVTQAIREKTDEVEREGQTVDGVVQNEISMFTALLGEVNFVITDLESLSKKLTDLPQIKLEMQEMGEGSLLSKLTGEFDDFVNGLQNKITSFKTEMSNIFEDIMSNTQSGTSSFTKVEEASDELKAFQQTYKDTLKELDLDFENDRAGSLDKVISKLNELWQIRKQMGGKENDNLFQEQYGDKTVALLDILKKNTVNGSLANDAGEKNINGAMKAYLNGVKNLADAKKQLDDLMSRGGVDADLSAQPSQATLKAEEMANAIVTAMQKAGTELSGELGVIDTYGQKLREVAESAEQITRAFETQAQTVDGAISGQTSSFDAFSGYIYSISEDINKLSNAIKDLPSVELKMPGISEGSSFSEISRAIASASSDIEKLNQELSKIGSIPLSKAQDMIKPINLEEGAKQAEEMANKIQNASKEIIDSYDAIYNETKAKVGGTDESIFSSALSKMPNDIAKVIQPVRQHMDELVAEIKNKSMEATKEFYSLFSNDAIKGLVVSSKQNSYSKLFDSINEVLGEQFKQNPGDYSGYIDGIIKSLIPADGIQNIIKQQLQDVVPDNIIPTIQNEIMSQLKVSGGFAGGVSLESISATINDVTESYKKLQMISSEGNNAPEELASTMKESMEAAQSGTSSWVESLEKVESKARELGVAFEESSGQWKNISDIQEPQVSSFDVIETMIQKVKGDLDGLIDYAKTLELTVNVKAPDFTLINSAIKELKNMVENSPVLAVKVHNPEIEPILDGIYTIKTLVGELKPIEVTVKEADFSPITKGIEELDRSLKEERFIEVSAKQLEIENITNQVDKIQKQIKGLKEDKIKLGDIDAESFTKLSREIDEFINKLDSTLDAITTKLNSMGGTLASKFGEITKSLVETATSIGELDRLFTSLGDNNALAGFAGLLTKIQQSTETLEQFSKMLQEAQQKQEALYKASTETTTDTGDSVSRISSEIAKFDELMKSIDLVTEAILQKNAALELEGSAANQMFSKESKAFEGLKEIVITLKKYIEEISGYFNELGNNAGLNSFNNLVGKLETSINAFRQFSEILKNAKEQQEAMYKTQDASGNSTATSNISREIAKIEELETVIDLVTSAILQKNAAFGVEATTVNSVVDTEVNALKRLQSALDSIGESLGILDTFFREVGNMAGMSGFTQMVDKIKKAEDAIKGFVEILKTSKEEQQKVIENANKATGTYDEDEMSKRANNIEEAAKNKQEEAENNGLVASIQRMYDSHHKLVQAIVTVQEKIHDDEERLTSVRTTATNIQYSKDGQEYRLFSSDKETDDFKRAQTEYSNYLNKIIETYKKLSEKRINHPELFTQSDSESLNEANTIIDELNKKKEKGIQLTDQEVQASRKYVAAQQDVEAISKAKKDKDNKNAIKEADKALQNYEKSVTALAQARTKLDFSKGKSDPKLVENLDAAIEKCKEAESQFQRLMAAYQNLDKADAKARFDRFDKQKRLYNDPTQSAFYKSAEYQKNRNEEENEEKRREKERADNNRRQQMRYNETIRRQNTESRKDEQSNKQRYSDNLAIIKKMKEDAEAAQKSMREIFTMMRNGDIGKDLYNNALSEFRKQKADIDASSIKKQMESETKSRVEAIKDEVKNTSEELKKAYDEMSKLEVKRIQGDSNITETDEWAEAELRLAKAFMEAANARAKLASIKDNLKTSDYNTLLKSLEISSDNKSDKNIQNAIRQRKKSNLQNEIDKYLKIINNAGNIRSNINLAMADEKLGTGSHEAVEKLEKDLEAVTEEAVNANKALRDLLNLDSTKSILGEKGFTSAQNKFSKSLSTFVNGSESSIKKLNQAEVKGVLHEYYKAISDYQDQLLKQTKNGTLDTKETAQMEEDLNIIKNIEKEWNDEKTKGISLSQRQKEMLGNIREARESDNEDYTKNNIESSFFTQQAEKAYSSLYSKIEKMRDQASWRAGEDSDWIAEVDKIQSMMKDIDTGDAIDVKSYKKVMEYIEQVKQAQQKLAKDTAWQPIATDEQDKALANLAKWMNQNKKAAKEFADQLDELKKSAKEIGSKEMLQEWNSQFADIQAKAADKGLLGKSLGDRFKDQFKNTMTSLATYYLSFQDFIRYAREAISVIRELDTQLTEMRKVSDLSMKSLRDYQIQTFDIADKLGTTAVQIQSSTADWLRLGKSLPEAQEMASLSTKLLNVSEFTDINDATQALVSSTQAYTDVTASDIVDKLNLIGNNFAVSTDELAQGLQNAAAVLKTQGNDIDQTLALLTAGNLVGQDMSKTSAGIRTIALRISGTEEAKNEIADMGEDIDDFVVRTKSKTDQIIRDYTAVASNAYKGVSVLDDNGNLRDTYDIKYNVSIYRNIYA